MGKIIVIRVPAGQVKAAAKAAADAARASGRRVIEVTVKVPRKG